MKMFQNITELCLLMMFIIIFNYAASSTNLKQPRSQLMPLGDVEEHMHMRHLTHVEGETVSFQRVREMTFTQVPTVIPTNASLISKHWDRVGDVDSSEEIVLFQQSLEVDGCKFRYRDDTQGCVFCTRSAKCPSGWSYHTWRSCGFGGCQSICKQQYDCPTPAPTTKRPTLAPTTKSPTTKKPTLSPTTKSPTLSPTTKSPTLSPTTPSPTESPTFAPSAAPTFAPFTIPEELKPRTPFVGFTGEFYIINEFNGMVIEQDILNVEQCSRLIDDSQGCVFCTRSSKCPSGSTYKTWRSCGFGGCQSICSEHYDCPDPFEVLYMDFIHSSKDVSNNVISKHSQLWHFNEAHNRIITSANDWVIQTSDDKIIAAADHVDKMSNISYDTVSRTIRIGDKFLCLGSDEDKSQLALCENSDSEESRWVFKTPEEAFPHEFDVMGKYYIASKENDLVVEQTYATEGYPLTTWIPDGSNGQLWYSDSHGRIRNDDGYIIEAVDVVVIKYTIPFDVPVGDSFAVSSSSHPDFHLVMTPELWHYRGSTNYLLPDISPEPSGLMSTSRIEDDVNDLQQWDLIDGQLVNGYNARKLAIDDSLLNGGFYTNRSRIGVECRLEDHTTDEFYLIPEAMIVSWIDLVTLKKFDMSYVREEAFFYQKIAAFHISTIIGLSPEELITRADYFEGFITEAVTELRKANKDEAIGSIVAHSLDLAGSVTRVIGFALAGPTWGLASIFVGIGEVLTLSARVTRQINELNVQKKERAGEEVNSVLIEIQESVVSGTHALASFLDDHVAAMSRLAEYNESPEGQMELQAMQEYANTIAIEVGYDGWESMFGDLFTVDTRAFEWGVNKVMKAYARAKLRSEAIHFAYVAYTLATTSEKGSKSLFNVIGRGSGQAWGIAAEIPWIFYAINGIVQGGIAAHKSNTIGEEMLNGAAAIRNNMGVMYRQLNALIGDVEDLRDLDAMIPESEMFFTNGELNDKWRTLTDMGNGELDSPVYGKLYDASWYPGCKNIPCARLD